MWKLATLVLLARFRSCIFDDTENLLLTVVPETPIAFSFTTTLKLVPLFRWLFVHFSVPAVAPIAGTEHDAPPPETRPPKLEPAGIASVRTTLSAPSGPAFTMFKD